MDAHDYINIALTLANIVLAIYYLTKKTKVVNMDNSSLKAIQENKNSIVKIQGVLDNYELKSKKK